MTLRNLTPHNLNLVDVDGGVLTLPPSGVVARVVAERLPLGPVSTAGRQLALALVRFGKVEDLPPAEVGVWLVVSALVLEAAASREDLVSPGELVRDAAGVVVGARGLSASLGLYDALARHA